MTTNPNSYPAHIVPLLGKRFSILFGDLKENRLYKPSKSSAQIFCCITRDSKLEDDADETIDTDSSQCPGSRFRSRWLPRTKHSPGCKGNRDLIDRVRFHGLVRMVAFEHDYGATFRQYVEFVQDKMKSDFPPSRKLEHCFYKERERFQKQKGNRDALSRCIATIRDFGVDVWKYAHEGTSLSSLRKSLTYKQQQSEASDYYCKSMELEEEVYDKENFIQRNPANFTTSTPSSRETVPNVQAYILEQQDCQPEYDYVFFRIPRAGSQTAKDIHSREVGVNLETAIRIPAASSDICLLNFYTFIGDEAIKEEVND